MVRNYDAFPSLYIYGIYWARNTTIFLDIKIPFEITNATIVQWSREHKMESKWKRRRLIKNPSIDKRIPWDFFDGASQ